MSEAWYYARRYPLGVAGAFIGVPLLIVALTICAEHESSRWLAILMSGGDAKKP